MSQSSSTVLANVSGGSMIKSVAGLARRNPIVTSAYAIGLLVAFFFAGFAPSVTTLAGYENTLASVDRTGIHELQLQVNEARFHYHNSRSFFFTCPETCQPHKKVYDELSLRLKELENKEAEKVREANSMVGLFSTIGVEETRHAFLGSFNRGKDIASRQSKWDMFFMTIRAIGRDENLLQYIFSVVLTVLVNYTFGVLLAVISFLISLFSLIYSYKASFLSAVTFYGLASLAAISFAATWVFLLWFCVGNVVIVGVKQADKMLMDQRRQRLAENGARSEFGYGGRGPAGPHGFGPGYSGGRSDRYDL